MSIFANEGNTQSCAGHRLMRQLRKLSKKWLRSPTTSLTTNLLARRTKMRMSRKKRENVAPPRSQVPDQTQTPIATSSFPNNESMHRNRTLWMPLDTSSTPTKPGLKQASECHNHTKLRKLTKTSQTSKTLCPNSLK